MSAGRSAFPVFPAGENVCDGAAVGPVTAGAEEPRAVGQGQAGEGAGAIQRGRAAPSAALVSRHVLAREAVRDVSNLGGGRQELRPPGSGGQGWEGVWRCRGADVITQLTPPNGWGGAGGNARFVAIPSAYSRK